VSEKRALPPEIQAKVKAWEAAVKAQDDMDLRGVLESEAGKRLLWRLFSECQVFDEIPIQSAESPFRLGKRSVGLWLLREVSGIQPDAIWKMSMEAHRKGLERKKLEEAR
jgi:hypothetical protein